MRHASVLLYLYHLGFFVFFNNLMMDNNPANNPQQKLQVGNVSQPPPLPPRIVPQPSALMTPTYGGYNYGGLGSSYGQYGTGMGVPYSGGFGNRFGYAGYPQNQESDFTRIAEESSRNAFQSVESVVQTVSSVSMMLESTLNAVYSSFRAITGVADQFSKLKTQFAGLFASITLFRFVTWLWKRMLVALRLKPANYANSAEKAWETAGHLSAAEVLGGSASKGPNKGSLLFGILAIGGPWLIWKLMAKIAANVEDSRKWIRGEGDHYEAKVLYDFNSLDNTELPVKAGQIIRIAPKESQPSMRGWLLGASLEGTAGLVPMNYIEILKRKQPSKPPQPDLEAAFNESRKMS